MLLTVSPKVPAPRAPVAETKLLSKGIRVGVAVLNGEHKVMNRDGTKSLFGTVFDKNHV